MYLDRGVPKEMKEKVKHLKKAESTHCCKTKFWYTYGEKTGT